MPGSTAEDPTKAKVTTANGVFIRPVAVAGIFRPAEDKPPALPEKRRFSALVGDLRPCSSENKSDDFLRRRQSWDTRQAPFGQALLKKTTKNATPTSRKSEPEVSINGDKDTGQNSAQINSRQIPPESCLKSDLKSSSGNDSSSVSDNKKKSVDSFKSSDRISDLKVSRIETESANKTGTVANSNSQSVSYPSLNKKSDANGTAFDGNINTVGASVENIKQPKKVYGLVKRDIKSETSVAKNICAVDNTTTNANDVAAKSTNLVDVSKSKTKVFGLTKLIPKKESEETKIGQIAEKDVKESVTNVDELSKEKVVLKNDVNNVSSTPADDKNVPLKSKELQNSFPKDFRPLRRTSDVIAAKIQNIFSNISSPGKSSQSLAKKTVEKSVEKKPKSESSVLPGDLVVCSDPSSKQKTDCSIKIPSDNAKKAPIEVPLKNSEKAKIPENVSQNFKLEGKNCDATVLNPEVTAVSSSSRFIGSAAVVNAEPLIADFKAKHSINATLSKGKKIEGKMPIKKADQNSSDGTLLLKATNQETDRKSPDSAFPVSTTMEGCKKEASLKKNAEIIYFNELGGSIETSDKIVSSTYSSSTKKVQQVTKTSILNAGETTVTKKEIRLVENSLKNSINESKIKNDSLKSNKASCDTSNVANGTIEPNQITKVEITKITPSTTPGIVPTVNVLFRTKSPQEAAIKEENRKKVVVETLESITPISSSTTLERTNSKQITNHILSNAPECVKQAFNAVENVQNSLKSPKVRAKHAIVNLNNEELATVNLSSISGKSTDAVLKEAYESFPSRADTESLLKVNKTIERNPSPVSSVASTESGNEYHTKTFSNSIVLNSTVPTRSYPDIRNSSSATCLYNTSRYLDDCYRSNSETMSVMDLGDWSKKFQQVDSDAPRAPLRRRSQRDPLPPTLPLRTSSRFGSLKRIEDSTRYIARSPSHSSLPQRYSYSEMLSKVCSMGVLPFVEPHHSKSFSSSSSQVSELWSELGEEQSTATHASEMLEAETSERMRLEKEVQELQNRYSQVQQKSDKMEMEIMEARVYRTPEVNGDISEDDDPEANSSLYKQKYERALRDMEIMKRRMQQQHDEEMEQKSMLKKASDKRLAEALEDVEEERQVANQWKRKAQKLGAELQDIRLMLEEQMARNGELEKKQRRFDSELSAAQEDMKKERALREKFTREKDQAVHEKYSLEQDLQASKIDSDMLHEKITQLNREIDELTLSSKGEEEVTQLKRAKQELERKNRDQEEELEELAAQVQMLEQAKLRLEMSLEKVRQEHRREASVREEEVEEIRASFSKKIKNLEAQLETEQDERHQLMKQKHELERCIYELSDQPAPQDPEIERRLRRDLKRTKALLKDAQSMLEHTREGQSGKTLIRQLKNQLEDSEFAKATAVKARQAVEAELQECQTQLEEVTRVKNESESRCLQLSREKSAIQTQLEEAEEEMSEVMKKYKSVVAQMSIDQKSLAEQNQQIAELETERQMLKDQLSEVSHKFEHLATQSEDAHKVHRLDSKVRDLESKLELEQTTRTRLEHQITRLKEQCDRMREESDSLRNKELQAQEGVRRLQRQLRDLRDDYSNLQQKEAEAYRKQHELEMALENIETDLQVTKNDLRLALQRIQDLQNALEDDLDSGTDVPDDSGSDSDSSFELSVLRNSSVTPVPRCESVASNFSYEADGSRSRTSSFSHGLSAFSSRNDAEKDINGFSGLKNSSQLLDTELDETV